MEDSKVVYHLPRLPGNSSWDVKGKRFSGSSHWKISPHVKESGFQNPGNFCIWNPESWKFLLVESGILGLGIRNTGVGIRNPTNNSNPESKFHLKRSGIQ